MNKFRILVLLALVSCAFVTDNVHVGRVKTVPPKMCIDECIKDQFKNFYIVSGSVEVPKKAVMFDKVHEYCTAFYSGEDCCKVRNPFDRLRSIFNFWIATPRPVGPLLEVNEKSLYNTIDLKLWNGDCRGMFPTYFDPNVTFKDFILSFEHTFYRKDVMFGRQR